MIKYTTGEIVVIDNHKNRAQDNYPDKYLNETMSKTKLANST